MFRGNFEHVINDQNRVSLPAKFRQVLEDRYSKKLILVGLLDHIEAYPEEEFRKEEEKDRFLPADNPAVKNYLLVKYSNVHETEVDSQGRILIPPKLRKDMGLEKEVIFNGLMEKIFIYNPERWASEVDRARGSFGDDSRLVAELRDSRSGSR